MARPREYGESTRVHMGTRFDKEIIVAFDALAHSYRMSRTQALECLVSQAVKTATIPPFAREILNPAAAAPPVATLIGVRQKPDVDKTAQRKKTLGSRIK